MDNDGAVTSTSTVGSDNAENSTPSQNPFAGESDGVGYDGAQQGENSSRGAERAGGPSRDAQQTESAFRDDQETESASRGDQETESASRAVDQRESASRDAQQAESASRGDQEAESASRDDQHAESSSRDAQLTESAFRDDQETESASRDAQQAESASRDAQQAESASRDDQHAESSSRDAQQTESASRGDQEAESSSRDDQHTESTSGEAQQSEGSSRDAEYAEDVERDAEHTSSASESALGTTGGAQNLEESSDNGLNLFGVESRDEIPFETSLLDGLASTLVLTEGDEYVNPLFVDDLDLLSGVDMENVELEDRDEGDDEKKTRCSQDDFAVSDVRIFRAGPAVCGFCPFHASVVERTSAADDLTSVDSLSGPSNIDVFRRTDVRGPSARTSDVFGGPSEQWQSALFPRPGPSTEPTPSTSREATRRRDSPYKTPVVTVSPTKSTPSRSVVEPPAPTVEPPARPSFFRRVLKRCCCGMGMKLRCFEGNSGTNSYFLLENLGADKDASTEKQEELQFFDDNGSYVTVVVEKNLRAIDLTQLLAVKNRVRKDYYWSIVEHWVEIGIERVLEDHEDVLSVHRQTESGAKKYIFRRFPNKYDFFSKPEDYFPPDMIDLKTYLPGFMYPEKHPEQLERVLTTAEELPVIFSQVNLRQECNRNIWIKTFLLLKDSKILMSSKVQVVAKFLRAWRETSTGYRPLEGETSIDQDDGLEQYVAIGEGNEEELEVLADLKDYEVYTSLNAKNQLKGPTEFGVVLRKTNEEDFADPVVLSFDKGKDRVCWVTAMRLAKYGKQLRENYKAFKNKQETISSNGSSANITESVRSRVAMDFTGKVGRIVDDPMEAKAIAVSEGNAWKKRLRAKAESSRCGGLTLEAGEEEKSHHAQPWYHKSMSREHASALISAHAKHDGVFVVRGSRSQPGGNVLSFKSQEKVLHFPIMMVEDPVEKIMCYTIDGGTTKFFDICQLVEFYRLNAGPLPTRLSNHLEKLPQPKTPGTSTKTDAQ